MTINIDQLRKISKRKHLKDYDLKQVFIDIGLFQDILIDCYSENDQINEVCDDITLDELMVSDDIERFNECWNSSQPIILPCPTCGEDRPFILNKAYKPHCNEENVITRRNSLYRLGENYLITFDHNRYGEVNDPWGQCCLECAEDCKKTILELGIIRKEAKCVHSDSHRYIADFLIVDPGIGEEEMPKKIREVYHGKREGNEQEKEYIRLFNKLKYCVILRKIGQTPSQAEAQLLGTSKYRKILGDHYSEFTLAIQLHASGVGAGSLIYLRRIFEFLLEELHKSCSNQVDWNEDNYRKTHINEKINLVENQGEILIPVELNPIRNKFYGALSKGIHSLSENECKELFPAFRTIIETILDAKISDMENQKKISESMKVIQQV